ncbi:unannotated protein [freshwater metagenome]|uniref:Unannotated protein n=1 Tax=freshwater metagenome TaxID=449393 RepID=A0A6J7V5B9_9ZZZZ|nr:hypothetical protein [Actinomycetota bacterium]MSY09760.1 hypothetical protein [Actinomycetota bacterium]MTA67323.1 hypothetical protein [Actinomycetota bacterium]MTB15499.1 hypothetical protein [Actinomycetota bacterium]
MSSKERNVDLAKWSGPKRPYDLIKELVIALVVVTLLIGTLAAVFSSPDERAVTLQQWSQAAPSDFVATATGELAGTTISAAYGPPYNDAAEGLTLGPLKLQKWAGITIPVNPPVDFVITPLKSSVDPEVATASSTWTTASADQQKTWAETYAAAIEKTGDSSKVTADASYGPVPVLATGLLRLAQEGSLDGLLTTQVTPLPGDFTMPMLFLADGGWFDELGAAQHLHGDQWGMMNETGSYPGQSWLWLFSFMYQIEPFKSSENADSQIFAVLMLLTLGFILIPKLPFINRLPRLIPFHRLIWRRYYKENNL